LIWVNSRAELAALLVDLAELPFQVGNQLVNALYRLGVRRDLPCEPTVPLDLYFEFYAIVLGHGIPNVYFYKTTEPQICSS
jgi:hypothetical protein